MTIIQKLKKHPLTKWVIITMIVLFIWGGMGEEKKEATAQSTCNIANTEKGGKCDFAQRFQDILGEDICMDTNFLLGTPEQTAEDACLGQECSIGRHIEEGYDTYGCFSCIPSGLRVKNAKDCCGPSIESNIAGDYDFLCKAEDPEDACKNSNEEKIASIFLYPNYIEDCGTAYMVTIFGSGFLALTILLAVI